MLRAGWLQAAARRAARLVSAGSEKCPADWDLLGFSPCLAHPLDAPPSLGSPCRILPTVDRPTPLPYTLHQWHAPDLAQRPPLAAVVVSLYNYADRILVALRSVHAQTQHRLELIVVDDASTDDGTAVVQRWIDDCLKAGGHPFVRVLLLRHCQNTGLAAARNTGFAHSQAPWSFVLDADNALFPDAVAGCLALADVGDPQLAVIHPWLWRRSRRPDEQRSLVRPQAGNWNDFNSKIMSMPWLCEPQRLGGGGGYTHIEGGWEDYDLQAWEGYHGLQCPRILAVYRSHSESMSHCATNRSWYALSRTPQQRHHWLKLRLRRWRLVDEPSAWVLRFVRGCLSTVREAPIGRSTVRLLHQRRRSILY